MRLLGIVGAGGFGREIVHIAQRLAVSDATECAIDAVCFVESQPTSPAIGGVPCLSMEAFRSVECEDKTFSVAVSDLATRQMFARELEDDGLSPTTLVSSTARVDAASSLGPGAILCDFTIITADAEIGSYFHMNLYSYVAHDCRIGDFVTFAPSVHCNGNVHIGDGAYIGTGALLRQGSGERPLRIGAHAIVGMGAVVLNDVPEGATVVGNPARVIRTR